MLYGSLIDLLCDRMKVDRKDASRPILADKINLSYKEIGNVAKVNWEHLKRVGEIVTVPNYTTGTCAITNGSRVVDFSGSALTSNMQGRYFKPQGSNNWYRIGYISSATQAVLNSPIIESTGSGLSFTIWKRFYYFPSEVRKVLEFGKWISDGQIRDISNNQLQGLRSDISLTGEPNEFVMYGASPFEEEYSVGRATLSKNSNLVIGTGGTEWLANAEPGDILEVGVNIYRVKRVQKDDQLVILNYAATDSTTSIYKIRKQSNLGIQLHYNPDQAMILPYTYIKRVYDMVNQNFDRPELPEEFDMAILDGAWAQRLSDTDDERWMNIQGLYSARINDLKETRFPSQMKARKMSPRIVSRSRFDR